MSVPEVRHLFGHLLGRAPADPQHYLLWSLWRRIHQTVAREYHYLRRLKRSLHLQL